MSTYKNTSTQIIERNTELCKTLSDYIEKYPTVVADFSKGGKDLGKFATVDLWQYMADLLNLGVSYNTDYSNTGKAKASCTLTYNDGSPCTGGTALASKEENFLKNSPEFAVVAMAETRAFSKAMRNKFGYLLKDIGINATPFEEMAFIPDMDIKWFTPVTK